MRHLLIAYLTGFVLSLYFAASVENKENIGLLVGALRSEVYVEKPVLHQYSGIDSIAMEFVYQSIPYTSQGEYEKALVLYKHVCTLDHELPGIFLSTGSLYFQLGDTVKANRCFRKEIEHSKDLIDRKPDQKTEFAIAIYESYVFLNDMDNARKISRKYGLTSG
ncbi:MAG: hypothetical protein A3D31_06780 [Candidatus Fluviicola riflensis]|nr:MAG: hypothetical protein CHH17_08230 [Candidatus Fluviicola riflensis]OGS79660.1 MAG: hypothetical protein A3D31_06780 [Candidatus Fluviicola riflensis]OGS87092.1 MAG: hypothetical protein A2724_06240 [Fluviicola sp. RIFCSPHIGHO2_01_FULL_43_53]OGS89882.1 MAG: hypothetical protein A3E30_02985 [Fluviicola sp. RIFCSPHIGHO2_12_FULL_43_24]